MDLRAIIFLFLLQLVALCYARPTWDQAVDNENLGGPDEESISETILRINNGSSEYLLEGDLVIPRARTAMKCMSYKPNCLWPKSLNGNVEVPIIIADEYTNEEKGRIVHALREIQAKTCIRFPTRTTQKSYISFEPKSGCSSRIGYMGYKQVVSLQRSGCVLKGIIQHEVLHSLGFHHEHTRSDRDQHVLIHWDNIQKDKKIAFKKQDTNNLNTPYDYSSVMHYGRTAFGINSAVTITPIPDSSVEIGEQRDLSYLDIIRINRLYKCFNYEM
ncbi:low choriolytic enzyme-like [Corythoichthys intestinalis]|uniref:low choriolytic enzyme-like n=1 Tax=Corythoichthys intestinalis TaxID=161448 RepID=UPI0025A5F748|nr:low choriolytic enzyme-like [Corythoichthys intestinalis]XP_061811063.1 low choriolytic enzyme-like [Nerophis lumbriciformis]